MYKKYSEFLSEIWPGIKVQKISVNAGLGCPNRDGTISTGGCVYCDNSSFSPEYCMGSRGIAEQIAEGKRFFGGKYPDMKYIAYFQSFTNTHAPTARLMEMYEEAVSQPDIVGLIIGTRPDCMPDDLIKALASLNARLPVIVEFGIESTHDDTLRVINRGHTWAQAKDAIVRTTNAGLRVGAHIIAGLPGETRDMILTTVDRLCALPISTIKIHQMQIIDGTALHKGWMEGNLHPTIYSVNEYLDLCVNIIEHIPHSVAIERFVSQSPPNKLIAPKWGLKNYQFTNLLDNKLNHR